MKTLLPRLIAAFILLNTAAAAEPLRMGVFPYHSPEQLVRLHKPLKDYLSHATQQPIRLVSAPDFGQFIKRTREGRYHILITAPHLGRMAERENAYRWLGFTRNRSRAVFITHQDAPIQSIADLQGQRLALPPAIAIIHQVALRNLENQGLRPPVDVTVSTWKSHDAALYAVLRGEADAAAIGLPTWRRYDLPEKDSLRVFAQSARIPGFALMLHPEVPAAIANAIRDALYRFGSTPEGSAYFEETGLLGIRAATRQDFEQLDRYLSGTPANGRP